MEWQPIWTAPKDETFVLLTGGKPDDWHNEFPPMVVAQWIEPGAWHDGYWRYSVSEGGYVSSGYDNPTHWSPLPPPQSSDRSNTAGG